MPLPPEPKLVQWYFANREPLPLSGKVDEAAVERNEQLWQAICEGGWAAARAHEEKTSPERSQ